MDSLDARVISRFPLSPSSAGTRMKTSVTFWKTSQCYKVKTEPRNFSAPKSWHQVEQIIWDQGIEEEVESAGREHAGRLFAKNPGPKPRPRCSNNTAPRFLPPRNGETRRCSSRRKTPAWLFSLCLLSGADGQEVGTHKAITPGYLIPQNSFVIPLQIAIPNLFAFSLVSPWSQPWVVLSQL